MQRATDGSTTAGLCLFLFLLSPKHESLFRATTLGTLTVINWDGASQIDKHGGVDREGPGYLLDPYKLLSTVIQASNFYLSCMDCHETHGSENIMLLRRRINGHDLDGAVTSTSDMGYVCKCCHTDDLAASAGTNEANRWEYVHHLASSYHPYSESGTCADCHAGGDTSVSIDCGNCHGHGMNDDNGAGTLATHRMTF